MFFRFEIEGQQKAHQSFFLIGNDMTTNGTSFFMEILYKASVCKPCIMQCISNKFNLHTHKRKTLFFTPIQTAFVCIDHKNATYTEDMMFHFEPVVLLPTAEASIGVVVL